MLLRAPWAKDLPLATQLSTDSFLLQGLLHCRDPYHTQSRPAWASHDWVRSGEKLGHFSLMWDNLDRPSLLENFPPWQPRLWWAALWLLPLPSTAFSLFLSASISNNSLALQSPSQCLLWEKPTCKTAWSQVASQWWSWASDTSSLPIITIPRRLQNLTE